MIRNPTFLMIAILAAAVAFGVIYMLTPDDAADGGLVRSIGGAGAIVLLLGLVALVSRGRQPEDRDSGGDDG